MEYEIEDEDVLFDDSTNPSLDKRPPQSAHIQPPAAPQRRRIEKRSQKGELIPEEEEYAA
jgi:hypothetical protein